MEMKGHASYSWFPISIWRWKVMLYSWFSNGLITCYFYMIGRFQLNIKFISNYFWLGGLIFFELILHLRVSLVNFSAVLCFKSDLHVLQFMAGNHIILKGKLICSKQVIRNLLLPCLYTFKIFLQLSSLLSKSVLRGVVQCMLW